MANPSAIVDIGSSGSDVSDYEDFGGSRTSGHGKNADDDSKHETASSSSSGGALNDVQQRLKDNVSSMMWETGKQQAGRAWSIYGNIDVLRPYFDVEPIDVLKRTVNSLVPKMPTATKPVKVASELYGPSMLVMTLIALLLYAMKVSGHSVQEGTLMGTAFGTCFGYWIGSSSFVWFVAYVCNTRISFLQLLSLIGYSLFSQCVVVLLSTVIHTNHDHMFFYLLWGIFGGLSTLRFMSILVSRTHGHSQKLILSAVTALLNLAFMLYLHFAYHEIVQEIDDVIRAANPEEMRVMKDVPAETVTQ